MPYTDNLRTIAATISALGGTVVASEDIGAYAVELALVGWRVFPLRGKVPAIPNAHPEGDELRGRCHGDLCDRHGHGVLDASSDVDVVSTWWSGRYAGANIGARVADTVMVIDIDPRHGGEESMAAHVADHGQLPQTLTAWSGRGDGGRHLYFRRPFGRLTSRHLGDGIDLKTSSGYTVVPPSLHPDTRLPYRWDDAPIADPPGWLVELVRPPAPAPSLVVRRRVASGPSVADAFTDATTWFDVLAPHGWRCTSHDSDEDGAVWLHPAATSSCSATVRHGVLFVYSPNTPFEITETGCPHGYTRFRAHAVLNHGGDLSAAARAFAQTGVI